MLSPDMAIDQDDTPAAAEATADSGQAVATAGAGLLAGAAADVLADKAGDALGADASGEDPQEEISIDFGEEDDEQGEDFASDVAMDESLDWDDFGAELDKEIAEAEALEESAADDLSLSIEEESPVEALADLDESLSGDDFVEELDESLDDSLVADLSEFEEFAEADTEVLEPLAGDEDGETLDGSDDLLADLSDETEDVVASVGDEALDAIEEIQPQAVEEESEETEDLEAGDVVMPLFADEVNEEAGKDDDDSLVGLEETLDFAGEDLPGEDPGDTLESPVAEDGEAVEQVAEEAGTDDSKEVEETEDTVIEEDPYAIDKEQCWKCGKEDSAGEPFVAIDGRLYCTDCMPEDESQDVSDSAGVGETDAAAGAAAAGAAALAMGADDSVGQDQEEVALQDTVFSVGGILRESWEKVRGVKGAVWAGSALMYAVLLVTVAGDAFLMPSMMSSGAGTGGYLLSALYQIFIQVITMLFVAGLLFMGIRRAADEPVSWKMIFHGFSFAGKIVVVTILQFILITIGFLLLVLPGIYLTVGYLMAIPLIVDKNVAPWQALEMSRKAIHKVWWKVFALYIIMGLIFMVATIPLGLGLIWAWPMAMVAAGVVYHRLFTV